MQYFKIIYSLLFLFVLSGCEKEIEVDVDEVEERLVVNANLSNRMNEAMVVLTKTIPLTSVQEYPYVGNAEVTITDLDTDRLYRLNEFSEGVYSNGDLIGEVGHTYRLDILLADGASYSSTQTMPIPTQMVDVEYAYLDISFGEDDTSYFEIQPVFQDMANVENFYQLAIYKNGNYQNELNLFKDLGFDGLENTQTTVIEANLGDEITCDLLSLTSSAYSYLMGVDYVVNQGSATPTNPISNISGDALGYFKVYSAVDPITLSLVED